MSLQIVTHCYNPPRMDIYAQLLKWQLASIINSPPRVSVIVKIRTAVGDACLDVIRDIKRAKIPHVRFGVWFVPVRVELSHLFRRAIGRDAESGQHHASAVWYTDCDYCFGDGCLDAVADQVVDDKTLYYPAVTQISAPTESETGHQRAEKMVAAHRGDVAPRIDPSLFTAKNENRAIGGIQIVTGTAAREHGYLRGTEWVKPVDPSHGFRSCKCDRAYRRFLKQRGFTSAAIDVPNLYRIRHTVDGRDFDIQGVRGQGKEHW